ncbi:unnamed protein product [Urochloa humidicola]
MEEVVADQAGGIRQPVKLNHRRRTGGRGSPEAAGENTPWAAGEEDGDRPAADNNLHQGEEGLAAQDEAAGDPDKKYLDKKWPSLMAWSLFFMWAKARPLTHPPAWVSRAARGDTSGEHHRLLQARLYVSFWALSFLQEVAIVVVLCLFRQQLVSAGRARAAVRLFMVAALASSCAVLAVVNSVAAGSDEGWQDVVAAFLTVAPAAAAAVVFVVRKVEELVVKVGRLFRG